MDQSMKCVIVASGEMEYTKEARRIIESSELIICADGGAAHLRAMGITPDVMMGDFDSITDADKKFFQKKAVRILGFPSRKNHTDSELCVNWAVENGASDITLLAATGSRLDHTLANIFLLKKLAKQQIPARIINPNNEIHAVLDSIELRGKPGDLLSVIPVTETACGVTLKGLEYPLDHVTIPMGSSLGISNVFKSNNAVISVKKGILIVTQSRD